MTTTSLRAESELIPRLEVGERIETGFRWVKDNLGGFFKAIRDILDGAVNGLSDLLNTPDALLLAGLLALLAWFVKDIKFGLLALAMLVFVIGVDQWENAMDTLSMVLVAAVVALVIAIPLGIMAARSARVSAVVRPIMDLMQTMPAFVWLVPVVSLFSIGVAPGVVATVIFCLPPGVRLTELGIRGVDSEVVEAGHSFGSSPWQILRGIQIPLAMPTIMAGVNQVIMLALSMAVIAGLVGAPGLGAAVATSIARIDIGLGFEAGLSVVALAIFLDRLTAAVGQRDGKRRPSLAILRRKKNPVPAVAAAAGTSGAAGQGD